MTNSESAIMNGGLCTDFMVGFVSVQQAGMGSGPGIYISLEIWCQNKYSKMLRFTEVQRFTNHCHFFP